MTSLTPCRRCHRREGCAIMQNTLAGLKGLRISKANVRCNIPRQDFPPGAPVMVQAFELAEDMDGEWGKCAVSVRGVVRAWKGLKATVILNKDQEIQTPGGRPISHIKAEPDRLTRIDAPPLKMCQCGGLNLDRCQTKDYPSTRDGGEWSCRTADEARLAELAKEERWF